MERSCQAFECVVLMFAATLMHAAYTEVQAVEFPGSSHFLGNMLATRIQL